MNLRWPEGSYITKEEYLEAFKDQNNIEWIEEDVFFDCLEEVKYPYDPRFGFIDGSPFYWNTQKIQPKMRKRSRIRDALKWFMTWLIRITEK